MRAANISGEESGTWRHCKKSGEIIERAGPFLSAEPLRTQRSPGGGHRYHRKEARRRCSEAERRASPHDYREHKRLLGDYARPEGRVATWNGAAERISGYRTEEI